MKNLEPVRLFVPFFRTEEVLAEIRECLERGWTGPGYKTAVFEEAWRRYTGLPYAHFLNSGTAALHTAFAVLKKAHGWQDGDEVITTPFTFISTNHAIAYERLHAVFADIDEHLCLDPASVAARLTPRTRAVCFVGIGGNPGRYAEVLAWCREHGLKMVLDATHMAGTWMGGKHAGQDADAAAFSFHAIKNVPTADSGMICFPDAALDRAARRFAWLGIGKDDDAAPAPGPGARAAMPAQGRYTVEGPGYKYHGNSTVASMALVSLRYLDEDNAKRREVAAWYDELLADLPRAERVRMASGCTLSRHLYQVLVPERDLVMEKLNERQIFTGWHYPDNTGSPMFAYARGTCPRAARAAARVLSLPLHIRLQRAEGERVAAALREVLYTLAPSDILS